MGLCFVTELCKFQDWIDRNTNHLAGKTVPIYAFHLSIGSLTVVLELLQKDKTHSLHPEERKCNRHIQKGLIIVGTLL